MKHKQIIAIVLMLAMLFQSIAFAADTGLLISPNPAAQQEQTALTQEEINKAATGFTDILPDAPYAADVKKLVEYGIIAGYPDGTFKPEGEVTRAEMCKMINLTLGYVDFSGAAGFPDVTTSNWYYTFALAAQKIGYVKGYEDGSFRGSNNITRQEVCAILDRLLKPMNLGIPVTITDEVAGWARSHVELIVQNFIMPLEANNTFRATHNLKRHELATVLSNMAIGPVKQIEADVRFFVNGEQYGETQTVPVGTLITVPQDPKPEKNDYVFDGWRVVGTRDVIDVDTELVLCDVDYEAVFAKKLHDVTFYAFKKVYDTRVAVHGQPVEAPKNPEYDGYEFVGWSLTNGGKVIELSETPISDTASFYAVFEEAEDDEDEITVTFYVNGTRYTKQIVYKYETPVEPEEPEREGYVFLGWALSSDTDAEIVDLSTLSVTEKLSLYAVFALIDNEPLVFTVKFIADGVVHNEQYVKEGNTPYEPAAASKDGYIFKYWSKRENGPRAEISLCYIEENTSFYAVFEEAPDVTFTVTFVIEDEVKTQTVKEGDKPNAPANPVKEGYKFKGWSLTNGGNVTSTSIEITEDVTFYAVFEKIEHTVSFYVDASIYDTQTVGDKESAQKPADPQKDGYIFKGWAQSQTSTQTVTIGAVKIISNTNFYAVFEEEPDVFYTIKFIVDGGEYDSFIVKEDEEFTPPANPQKENYKFLGWSKSEGGKVVTVKTTPTEDINYYAVFEEIKKYTVSFYANGEIYGEPVEVVENSFASAPVVKIDGYTFNGWTLDGVKVDVGSVKITKDTDFHAILEETVVPTYTVTFKNGTQTFTTQTVEEGKYPQAQSGPEKDDYKFIGWAQTPNGDVVDITAVKITENVTFYARFEKIPVYYEVTFVSFDDEYDTQKILEGEFAAKPSPDPSKDGYKFLGWSKTEEGAVIDVSKVIVNSDTIYYAVFEKIPVYFDVVFMVSEKQYGQTQKVLEGEYASLPEEPEKTGFAFRGWSVDGTKTVAVESYKIKKNTTFTALFEEIKYTVKFVVDSSVISTQSVAQGNTPSIPAIPSKDGYAAKGWSKTANGAIVTSFEAVEAVTYYAVYEEVKLEVFNVTFNVNGAESVQQVEKGKYPEKPQDPVVKGYKFKGWSKTADGAIVTSFDAVTADVVYYAVFEAVTYSVTFKNGTQTHDTQTVNEGKYPTEPSEPQSANGGDFMGWAKTEDSTNVVDVTSIEITENTVYYAVFAYTVTFISDDSEYTSQIVYEGEYPTKPADPKSDSGNFMGWSKTESGTSTVDVTTVEISKNTTYYAVFKPFTYTVTFIADGQEIDVQTVVMGEYPTLPAEPDEIEGYVFKGWSKTENGTNVVDVTSVEITKNTTYYAVYEPEEVKEYKVIFYIDGEPFYSVMVPYGETVEEPTVTESDLADDKVMMGWSTTGKIADIVDFTLIKITAPSDFYLVYNPNDKQLLDNLSIGATELSKIRATGVEKEILTLMSTCMSLVIEDANTGTIITKDYVTAEYGSEYVDVVKEKVGTMSGDTRSAFVNKIKARVSDEVQEFMMDFFDISATDIA